ncbi:hypothetical protein GF385_01490 [Candidatus Dependentiae bacterium]|nr:hypothetical protein [Candidatus Dependentiae bacterium]
MPSEFSKNPLVDKIEKSLNFIKRNKKMIGFYFLGLIVLIALLVGYLYYKEGLEKRAHKDLLVALRVWNSKVIKSATNEDLGKGVFSSEKEKWEHADSVLKEKYERNKATGIAPIFLAYRVEALLSLGRIAEAIDVQKLLIKHIPTDSDLRGYNKIKLSLMRIDTGIEKYIKKGLEKLKKLAYEQAEPSKDEALYRLGEYYWDIKNFKEAANYWNQLIIKFGKTSKYPSIWVDIAKPKLKTIVV